MNSIKSMSQFSMLNMSKSILTKNRLALPLFSIGMVGIAFWTWKTKLRYLLSSMNKNHFLSQRIHVISTAKQWDDIYPLIKQ